MALEGVLARTLGNSLLSRLRRSFGAYALAFSLGSVYVGCGSEQKPAAQQETLEGCIKDSDCKGERICINRQCVFLDQIEERDSGYIDTGAPPEDSGPNCIDQDNDGFYGMENCGTPLDCDDNDRDLWQLLQGYTDADRDDYGTGDQQNVCSGNALPAGFANLVGDCNDNDRNLWQNLSGYRDADGDGFGAGNQQNVCSGNALPAGYVDNNRDCSDNNRNINPNAQEVCDQVDNNCEGGVDEGVLTTFYADRDRDGFGTEQDSREGCAAPIGYIEDHSDCDDNVADIHPGALQLCASGDNNCDDHVDCSELEGMIAFSSTRDGNTDIYVINADGSNEVRLTDYGTASMPSWSPDGRKIAFVYDDILSIINSDGTDLNLYGFNGSYSPSYSHDGRKLIFSYDFYGNDHYDIYVMDIRLELSANLTLTDGVANDFPVYSPDDRKIAFDSERDGNWEIYVMNADGTNQQNLTNNPAEDAHSTWSPDGRKIAFHSTRDGNAEIYLMNADGRNPVRLTNNNFNDEDPHWSRDGHIVFVSNREGNDELYIMDAEGSNLRRLTNNQFSDLQPAWYP